MGAFFRWFPIVSVVVLACSGCTKTPPDPSGRDAFESRASAQQQGQVTVRAAVLGDEESSRFFGVSLADEGMQAVWFSVNNDSDGMLYYLPATTDADYYTPPEASRTVPVREPWAKTVAGSSRRTNSVRLFSTVRI